MNRVLKGWLSEEVLFEKPVKDRISEPLILVDGRPMKQLGWPHLGIVKGDDKSLAIAMASIIAKVTRDRMMVELAKYPGYGLAQHMGYATEKHRNAILESGPTAIHRCLFLRNILKEDLAVPVAQEEFSF